MITMAWGSLVLGWFRMDFHFCCVSPHMLMVSQLKGLVCWVVVVFFFSWGGVSLSLCFCSVLDCDHLLFLLCSLGFISTQSGEGGVSGGGRGGGGGIGGVVGE